MLKWYLQSLAKLIIHSISCIIFQLLFVLTCRVYCGTSALEDCDFAIEIFFFSPFFFCLGPIFMFFWMANKKFLTSPDVMFFRAWGFYRWDLVPLQMVKLALSSWSIPKLWFVSIFFLCLSFTYINALFFCGRHSFSRCLLPPHSHASQRDHLFTAAHSLLGLCGSNVGALPHLPHPVPPSQELLVLLVLLQCGLPSFSVFLLLFFL